MYETPQSLQDCCVDYICANIDALCEVQTSLDDARTKLIFKNQDVFFHNNISDQILETLSEHGQVSDETMSLFNPHVMCLKHVKLKDASTVSVKGLRSLKSHKITELEAVGLRNVTVNDLIGCLGEWTLSNLYSLNVANSTFVNSAKFCVVVSLSKLKKLKHLNVSNTEFNKHGLEIIAEDLTSMESLDISCTPVNDITPLCKCKDRLKSLSMYNLRASHNDDIVPVLWQLSQLRHLDVSDDFSVQPFVNLQPVKFRVEDLLKRTDCLPYLTSLDISGKDGLSEQLIRSFLEAHPHLRFLGLALTTLCEVEMFTDTDNKEHRAQFIVSGEATVQQIMEALKRYSTRPVYVQKALYNLFSMTQGVAEPRVELIQLILPGMKNHPKELGVQMAATACLYNLTKGPVGHKIHPACLSQVVDLTLTAMDNFPNHQQLQKNALLTLCSDRILQDVTFERYRCARLVMECLCSFDDASMNRMSVAICSILAAKISTEQTSQLGAKASYMRKLLAIVKQKSETQAVDITMKFTLSALWNLTDESPATCGMFLNESGLDLFTAVLKTYQNVEEELRTQVETKVLGLINNLAEVGYLRKSLMREDLLILIRQLMHSKHIDVSYFAAGIVSHLMSDRLTEWEVPGVPRDDVLKELAEAVMSWEQPKGEMVAYRSFNPFFPLLSCVSKPEVQLWAVWAIQHVCTKNGSRYCLMLIEEGGSAMLESLVHNAHTSKDVVRLATNVLQIVQKHRFSKR